MALTKFLCVKISGLLNTLSRNRCYSRKDLLFLRFIFLYINTYIKISPDFWHKACSKMWIKSSAVFCFLLRKPGEKSFLWFLWPLKAPSFLNFFQGLECKIWEWWQVRSFYLPILNCCFLCNYLMVSFWNSPLYWERVLGCYVSE